MRFKFIHCPAVVCLQTMRGAQTHPSRAFCEYPAGRRVTTDSNHKFNIAPNLLDRNVMADQPNQKWAGDITYIWTREGGLYLAVIHRPAGFCAANAERDGPAFKACDRPLMVCKGKPLSGNSWAVSNRMKRDLAIRALKMAIAFRAPPKGCIYYPAGDYKVICREGIIRIVGRNIVRTIIRKFCGSMASKCP